jgi:hypothetical protein
MNGLVVNCLLEYPDDDKLERVRWIDPGMNGLYAINIQANNAFPEFRSIVELDRVPEDGDCRFAEADRWAGLSGDEDVIPIAHRARRDRSWALIRSLVSDQPSIFEEARRGPAINRVMMETGSNKMTPAWIGPSDLARQFVKPGGLTELWPDRPVLHRPIDGCSVDPRSATRRGGHLVDNASGNIEGPSGQGIGWEYAFLAHFGVEQDNVFIRRSWPCQRHGDHLANDGNDSRSKLRMPMSALL